MRCFNISLVLEVITDLTLDTLQYHNKSLYDHPLHISAAGRGPRGFLDAPDKDEFVQWVMGLKMILCMKT